MLGVKDKSVLSPLYPEEDTLALRQAQDERRVNFDPKIYAEIRARAGLKPSPLQGRGRSSEAAGGKGASDSGPSADSPSLSGPSLSGADAPPFSPLKGRELGRVHINPDQYFEGVPQTAWEFHIGGYQPAQKWLKDRKGRALSFDDVMDYQRIIKILCETDRIMKEIELPL
jgi:Type ISP C-terminal specificity domain